MQLPLRFNLCIQLCGCTTVYLTDSMNTADAKSFAEFIARSFGYIYGREHNVRVNTISQSPTMTTAGSGVKGMDKLFDFANRMSPLGNASADECADYCIVMFSDPTVR